MTAQGLLAQAADIRRAARREWFLASGESAVHVALIASAVALERAAQELARRDNRVVRHAG